MKIYTKTGDKGETSLIGGTRIPKFALRIEAYGTIDELNSYTGLIRDQNIEQAYIDVLLEIQDRLFTIGSNLAADPIKSKMKLPTISTTDIQFLEKQIDEMDETLPPMRSFVLPGGHTTVSFCHLARCICRRAERKIIELSTEETVQPEIIAYVNRLSDYFFMLSRKLSQELNAIETPWVARM
jgi:cob(I)alamin adenosyltransferase